MWYINTVTGTKLETTSLLEGGNWVKLEEAEPENAEKKKKK